MTTFRSNEEIVQRASKAAQAVLRQLLNETAGPLEFALACDILREFYVLTLEGKVKDDTIASRAQLLPMVESALREAKKQWDRSRKVVVSDERKPK